MTTEENFTEDFLTMLECIQLKIETVDDDVVGCRCLVYSDYPEEVIKLLELPAFYADHISFVHENIGTQEFRPENGKFFLIGEIMDCISQHEYDVRKKNKQTNDVFLQNISENGNFKYKLKWDY